MKPLLTIAFLCLIYSGKAQQMGAILLLGNGISTTSSDTSKMFTGTLYIGDQGQRVPGIDLPARDTVPILMLVTENRQLDSGTRSTMFLIPYAYQIEGFAVRIKKYSGEGQIDPEFCQGCNFYYMQTIYYLGGDKHSLSKSINVWQVK